MNASAGHLKRCGRPHLTRGPLFAHAWRIELDLYLRCLFFEIHYSRSLHRAYYKTNTNKHTKKTESKVGQVFDGVLVDHET